MKRISVGILAAAALLAVSCSKKAVGPEVEVIDGVQYLHNPAAPLQPELTVSFEEELTIGGDEKSEEAVLYRPRSILVDEKDFIYVSDYQDAVIKVFDPEGHYVRTIGKKGGGPGEFQAMTDIAFLPDHRLLVFDIQGRRTSLFDRAGEFISSHPWRNSHFQLLLTDDSGYLADENFYGEERKLLIRKYDLDGKEIEEWGAFTPMGLKIESRGDVTLSITTPYTPQSIFAGDQARKRLYHCFNDTYLIEVYDGPGRVVKKIDRPYKAVPFTKKDAEDYFAAFDRRGNKVFSEMAREVELPKVKTVTEHMFVDDLGNLWVATNEIKEEGERPRRAYDIFNPDGHYTCRIWLGIRPGIFVRGKMYSLHSDEESGFISVKRYRVIWSD